MTTKNIKIVLFGALMVAMILPFSGMNFATAQKTPNENAIQIQKPEKTQQDINDRERVLVLHQESIQIKKDVKSLREIAVNEGMDALSIDDQKKLDAAGQRLQDIIAELRDIDAESRKQYFMTPEDKAYLTENKQAMRDSGIPYGGLGTDKRVGALTISFETQEEADKWIPEIKSTIDVPFYVEILPSDEFADCTNTDSNCDPLMGGI